MTHDEIIRMAQEARQEWLSLDGRSPSTALSGYWFLMEVADLARFAALVAAAEREACAKVCEQLSEDSNYSTGRVWGRGCARAIRARGTTPTFSPATLTSPRGSLGEEV